MSRTDVLADADGAKPHLGDQTAVLAEVDEDVSAYDAAHLAGPIRLNFWATEPMQAGVRDDRSSFAELLLSKGMTHRSSSRAGTACRRQRRA